MTSRLLSGRHVAVSSALGATLISSVLLPFRTLHAEEPASDAPARKPIYDDLALIRNPPPKSSTPPSTSPTPTDRLATRVRQARLFLHDNLAIGEDRLNAFMSTILAHENSFTSTIASLAPPREAKEKIMPGAIYVLVATMAGSIISRNRNILLRATFPAAVGIGAAWMVLPVTMRNVSDLMWTYEEKAPVIAENHLKARGAIVAAIKAGRERSESARKWTDESVTKGRQAVEDFLKKKQ